MSNGRKIAFPSIGVIEGSRVWRNRETGVEIVAGKGSAEGLYYVYLPTLSENGQVSVGHRRTLKAAQELALWVAESWREVIATAYEAAQVEDELNSPAANMEHFRYREITFVRLPGNADPIRLVNAETGVTIVRDRVLRRWEIHTPVRQGAHCIGNANNRRRAIESAKMAAWQVRDQIADAHDEALAENAERESFQQSYLWARRHDLPSGRREHIQAAIAADHAEALDENDTRDMLITNADRAITVKIDDSRGMTMGPGHVAPATIGRAWDEALIEDAEWQDAHSSGFWKGATRGMRREPAFTDRTTG